VTRTARLPLALSGTPVASGTSILALVNQQLVAEIKQAVQGTAGDKHRRDCLARDRDG